MTRTALAKTTTNATEPDVDELLERAQARVDKLKSELAAHQNAISTAKAERKTSVDPDRIQTIDIEIPHHERHADALGNELRNEAEPELEQACRAQQVQAASDAAKVATSAQLQLKARASDYVRKLHDLFKAQGNLGDAVKDFDQARARALELAAATGQAAPKLHTASGFALARAQILGAMWSLGIRNHEALHQSWCTSFKSLSTLVFEVRQDMEQPQLPELQERLTDAQRLAALIDGSYPDLVREVYAAGAEQRARMIASSEAFEKKRAEERKAARDGRSNLGVD